MKVEDLFKKNEDGTVSFDTFGFVQSVKASNEREANEVADRIFSEEDPHESIVTLCTNIYTIMDLVGAYCAVAIREMKDDPKYEMFRGLSALLADMVGYEDIAAEYDPAYTESIGLGEQFADTNDDDNSEYDVKEIA